jgi:hypothetical protein
MEHGNNVIWWRCSEIRTAYPSGLWQIFNGNSSLFLWAIFQFACYVCLLEAIFHDSDIDGWFNYHLPWVFLASNTGCLQRHRPPVAPAARSEESWALGSSSNPRIRMGIGSGEIPLHMINM